MLKLFRFIYIYIYIYIYCELGRTGPFISSRTQERTKEMGLYPQTEQKEAQRAKSQEATCCPDACLLVSLNTSSRYKGLVHRAGNTTQHQKKKKKYCRVGQLKSYFRNK